MAEQKLEDEQANIWESQVLISFPDTSFAYLDPLQTTDVTTLKEDFPCINDNLPLIFSSQSLNPNCLDGRVFRTWPKDNKGYDEWLKKVEK